MAKMIANKSPHTSIFLPKLFRRTIFIFVYCTLRFSNLYKELYCAFLCNNFFFINTNIWFSLM